MQINIHKNNGIKTNYFSFILMIHWWLKEHLLSRTCQVTNWQYAYIFFKKSELFCFYSPTRLICYGKTDANQTIDCGLSPCVFYPPFGLMAVLLMFLSYMLSMVLVLWEVGAILGDRYGTQGQN